MARTKSAQSLSVTERQKVVRLLVKEIVVEVDNRITILHCLPLMGGVRNASGGKLDCYPLCTGSRRAFMVCIAPAKESPERTYA